MTATQVRIDFVSDVVCPWCAIGLASLEQALAELRDEVSAEIHVQPFELDPQMPLEGREVAENLKQKYGMSDAQLEENQVRIRERGAELGFTFNMQARGRTWNTFDAHRLLHWAQLQGQQLPLKHALLRAHFTEGRNISDAETLATVAAEAGLDATKAAQVLASGQYAEDVRTAEQFFQQQGIRSVPAVIIDRKYLVSGGQPPEVFVQALRQAATQISK